MQGGEHGSERPPASERSRWADTLVVGARPGDVLAGKYRVDRVLGTGGVGVVVAATHLQLDERVAIKFLLPAAMKDPDAVARFDREARAAARIKSDYVARVTDVGTLETGAPYMVMEYLDGHDLSAVLDANGPMPFDAATEYVLHACEAIAEAHAIGIVHRDLKPSNLFLTFGTDGSPRVKVLDFGISKLMPRTGSMPDGAVTRTTAVMGSPLYMSPEQMESARDVDERTDIWGAGVILYELLTGAPAYNGATMAQVCTKIIHGAPPPMRERRPDLPAELEAVVLRCLAKSPSMRFADVGELALALLPFAPRRAHASVKRIVAIVQSAGIAGSALRVPPSAGSVPMIGQPMGALPSTQGAWGSVQTTASTRTTAPIVVAVTSFVVVCGIAAGFLVARGRAGTSGSAAAPTALATATADATASASEAPTRAAASSSIADPASSGASATATTSATGAPLPAGKRALPRGVRSSATSATTTARRIDPGVLDER